MDNKLILENRFTNHQKIHILLSIGSIPLIIIFVIILKGSGYVDYIILFFAIVFYFLLIGVSLTKKMAF